MNPLQEKAATNSNPVNSMPKSAADIKQDLSGITEIKTITQRSNTVFVQIWQKLTKMF